REAQRQMAISVTEVIDKQGVLIAEAGTGTGKTYAYLVPALRSGKKTIISTGSKALQDQLYSRDLPTIIEALDY
ncbi:DEAD/DEAH box helicase, partial [Proteus mirabilis]